MPKTFNKYNILIIIILLLCNNLTAQNNPIYKAINTTTGLPNNSIYDIKQDKKGFIWLASDKGLVRYDGSYFKKYPIVNPKSISVSNILEGPDGKIYCQDFIGNTYVTNGDSLNIITNISDFKVYAQSFFVGNILCKISFEQGLVTYNIVDKQKKVYPFPVNATLGRKSAINNNTFYFYDDKVIYSFNGETIKQVVKLNNIIPEFVIAINGQVYITSSKTENKIYKIVNNSLALVTTIAKNKLIQNTTVVNNEIWISTTTGYYCFNENFEPKYGGNSFYETKNCSNVFIDREDNYWFTTLNDGVLLCPSLQVNILAANYKVNCILAKDNNLILGSYENQLATLSILNNSVTPPIKLDVNKEVISMYYNPSTNDLLVGSDKLYVLNNNKIKLKQIGSYKSITYIKNNLYAFATSEGIILKYINSNNQSIPFKYKFKQTTIFLSWYISTVGVRGRSVAYNKINDCIYYSNSEGLYYVTKDTIAPITFNGNSIKSNQLLFSNNKLYASSITNGLFVIENNQVIKNFTTNDGLIDNSLVKIFKYKDAVWCLSEKGVQQFNETTKESKIYNSSDGLPNEDVKDIIVNDSIIFLATSKGLISFNYTQIIQGTAPPLIELNNFIVNGNAVIFNNNMAFKQSTIDIEFAVLAFRQNSDVALEYSINNGEWLKISSKSRTLNLPSLAPGNYTITLRAINDDNLISDKPLTLNFEIKAPFYKTWWFVMLCIAFVLFLAYMYYLWQINLARKTSKLLQEKLQLEKELHKSTLGSIKSQMNPHFIFNALNTIQSYIYTNEKENASIYLGKFSELTRLILDMSNKEAVPLNDELKALHLYLELEKLRFEDAIAYAITVNPNIDIDNIYLPSMLIQPYVENAVKHGLMHQKNNPKVTISFFEDNSNLIVVIDDNGIGRKESEQKNKFKNIQHQSFAVGANKARLDILNKGNLNTIISALIIDKTNQQGEPLGTKVTLSIPIIKKHL